MAPLLHDGDVVFYKPLSFQKIRVDDIVVVKTQSGYYTHRVVYIGDNFLITKGDNTKEKDQNVSPEQIVGKVYKVKRNGVVFPLAYPYLVQSSIYFKEISEIIREFNTHNIRYVMLKGLSLHLFYEKKKPQRIYADCDILVDKSQWQKIKAIFKQKGYICFGDSDTENLRTQFAFLKNVHEFPILFDVHTEPACGIVRFGDIDALYPASWLQLMSEDMLKSRRSIQFEGSIVEILQPSLLIPYLALHLFQHNFRGIFRLAFIDRVIRHEMQQDSLWPDIEHFIQEYRLRNYVYPVFLLLKKYYDTPIPESFLRQINPPLVPRIAAHRYIVHIDVFRTPVRVASGIERFIFHLLLSPVPLFQRIGVFFHPQVVSTIFQILSVSSKFIIRTGVKKLRLLKK